jgi:hypothetical protein
MSSLVTAYFCEPEALEALTRLFAKALKVKPEEKKIIEFMRKATATGRYKCELLVLRGLSKLLNSNYCNNEMVVSLLRESLKKVNREGYVLIEANHVTWAPSSRHEITIDDIKIPVADLDIDKTLQLQEDYEIKNFIIAKI